MKTRDDIPVYYKRKVFEAEDAAFAGSFAVDFVVEPYDDNTKEDASLPPRTTYYDDADFERLGSLDEKPMLVALHGLSGGSHEIYLRSVLWQIMQQEWEVCVVNSRGCALSAITSGVLYNARSTWDLRQVVEWLAKMFPNRPLFGVGFSLGANILVNVRTADNLGRREHSESNSISFLSQYLGEEGSGCLLKAAVVCSNPWNLDVGSVALQRSWLGREVYSRTMGSNMKALFEL